MEARGTQADARAGLHALARFSDRIGLGLSSSTAIPWAGEPAPLHDRGTVLTHAMLMLAAGGEACSDIEFLGPSSRLSGAVASDSTLYRVTRAITPTVLADLTLQASVTRSQVVEGEVVPAGGFCCRDRCVAPRSIGSIPGLEEE